MSYRSLLFVPGARPDRFEKALAAGADAVCIDLEDAVAPSDKATARRETIAFLGRARSGLGLRINALSTLDGFRDVIALAESAAQPAFLMVPKTSGAEELLQLRALLGANCPPLFPLMETAEARFALPAIARAIGAGGSIIFGGADYSAAIGSDMSWDALYAARAAVVAAAALSGCGTLDVPHLDVKDAEGLRLGTARAKAMGFTGRACIHPDQVPVVNAVFTPTADDIARAEKVIAAYKAAGGGVALLDGKLIEAPVLRAAERTLAAKRN